jgi:hypothetical protein
MSQENMNNIASASASGPDVEKRKSMYLTMVVDRSGSMMSCGVAVFEGITKCIKEKIKFAEEQKMDICLSIFTFDDKIERLDIPTNPCELKTEHYEIIKYGVEPRGWTRLYDAVHQAAMYTTTLQETNCDEKSRGFMVIITDGEDNQSDMKHDDLRNEIKSHQETGMEYIFIGANINAEHTGTSLGISANACMQFTPDPSMTQNAFSSLGMAIQRSVECDDVLDNDNDTKTNFRFTKLERFSSCSKKDQAKYNITSNDDNDDDDEQQMPKLISMDDILKERTDGFGLFGNQPNPIPNKYTGLFPWGPQPNTDGGNGGGWATIKPSIWKDDSFSNGVNNLVNLKCFQKDNDNDNDNDNDRDQQV